MRPASPGRTYAPLRASRRSRGLCAECGRSKRNRALGHCGRRACPGYAPLWAGDQAVRIRQNLDAYALAHDGAKVVLSAVTAPGADVLPWHRRSCSHPPGVACSGTQGCKVDPQAARTWNRTAQARFSLLHQAASERVRVRFGRGALRVLVQAWQLQSRGVLHVHPVLGCATKREWLAAQLYCRELQRMGGDYGFGFSRDRLELRPARVAAAYLSKYLLSEQLQRLVGDDDAPARLVYVDRRLTKTTRVTMRNLRLRRSLAWRGLLDLTCAQAERIAFPHTSIESESRSATSQPQGP